MKGIGRVIPSPNNAGRGDITYSETMENPTAELGSTTKSMEGKEQWISLRASGSITSV